MSSPTTSSSLEGSPAAAGSCPVCYDDFGTGPEEAALILPCRYKHQIHTECIRMWLTSCIQKNCPLCRSSLKHTCGHALDQELLEPGGTIPEWVLQERCHHVCQSIALWTEPDVFGGQLHTSFQETLMNRRMKLNEQCFMSLKTLRGLVAKSWEVNDILESIRARGLRAHTLSLSTAYREVVTLGTSVLYSIKRIVHKAMVKLKLAIGGIVSEYEIQAASEDGIVS